MLTPRFEISQTDAQIKIIIHAPYADIKETEVYVDGTDFRFCSTPYYLRLRLTGEIKENDSSFASYDCDKGDFTLKFSKVNHGEYFENLDMISVLLAPPKKKSTIVPNIEVIGNPSAGSEDINDIANENIVDDENTDGDEWYIQQNNSTESVPLISSSPKYGFANKISGALAAFESAWIKEIIDLPSPDTTPQSKRRALREARELLDFNEEHYFADLMQPDCVEPYLAFSPEWDSLEKDNISFNETEVDLLKELPNKEYLLDNSETRSLLLSLVDILFGSCYNHRTTLGENTVESSWTVNKLSSTLSWFDAFTTPEEVVEACIRRSLCYPLFRNWNLSLKVLEDVKKVVKLGKKYIIKHFCEIHGMFNNSCEPRYILNQLYIKDYLIWLQQIHESQIRLLDTMIADIHPKKEEMGLDLVELEQAAYYVQEDLIIENVVHEMVDQMDELKVNDNDENGTKTIYYIKDNHSLKYLLSSSSSSSDSSDSDSESDSETSTSSTTTTSDSSSLDSDDASEPEEIIKD